MPQGATVMPCLVYADAPRAIDFLCDGFGFTRHLVVPGGPGEIVHAQLTLGSGMVMLSSAKPQSQAQFGMVPPSQTGNLVTGCICVFVADPDAHFATAVAAGAEPIGAVHDNDYGGRGYEVRDFEGNVWSFGSYDPWA